MATLSASENDFSREIYLKYFSSKGRILEIILKNDEVLNGIFVSFFHGDPDRREPFIIMWRFVKQEEMDDYHESPDKYQEYGRIVHQKDIKHIRFI